MKKLLCGILVFCGLLLGIAQAEANSGTEVNYGSDTIILYFDEREWRLDADNDPNDVFYEYTVDGQTVNNWRELVTLQMYYGRQNQLSAEEFSLRLMEQLRKTGGDKITFSVIRDHPDDYMFAWQLGGHAVEVDQGEIDRVIAGKDSLIILHYVKRPAMSEEEWYKWVDILNSAIVE